MMTASPLRLFRKLRPLFEWTMFFLIAAVFFSTLHHFQITAQFLAIAAVCAPTLAIFFGFSGLLYSRARALVPGVEQRRCLYAAERALQASLTFMVAAAVGALVAAYFWEAGKDAPHILADQTKLFLWFSLPIFLSVMSFGCFFLSVRTVAHRLVRVVQMRELVRRLKKGL